MPAESVRSASSRAVLLKDAIVILVWGNCEERGKNVT